MSKDNMKLGIIGGMGPLASADFFRRVIECTEAERDQDHIETYIISDAAIPRRVEFILGESDESPAPAIRNVAERLEKAGVDIIAMPCVTAHFFYDEITKGLKVPVINMLSETGEYLKKRGIRNAGIMGTKATVKSGILQKTLKEYGIAATLPDTSEEELLSRIIFDEIKPGKNVDMEGMYSVINSMRDRGADTVLVACTDLSAALKDADNGMRERFTDTMDILAVQAVRKCGKKVSKRGRQWTDII